MPKSQNPYIWIWSFAPPKSRSKLVSTLKTTFKAHSKPQNQFQTFKTTFKPPNHFQSIKKAPPCTSEELLTFYLRFFIAPTGQIEIILSQSSKQASLSKIRPFLYSTPPYSLSLTQAKHLTHIFSSNSIRFSLSLSFQCVHRPFPLF